MRVLHRNLICASLGVLGVTATAAAQCPDGTPPPCRRAVTPGASPTANSVAVLYFENLSRDTADAYIADGLTEEITARLGQLGRLVVTSRTGARRLRAAAAGMSPLEIGRALNVSYLVNGSVRHAGPRLRATVELLRASTGVQVWSNQYDRSTSDLLGIQEEIALSVAAGIVGRLLPGERARLASRPTRSPEAYDHYLRGSRTLLWIPSPEGFNAGIAEFEAALRLDPRFTAARGRMAYAYGWAFNWAMSVAGLAQESVAARGRAAADQALREDSTSADAWTARGFLLFFGDPPDYEGALTSMRRAVLLDTSNALAHHTYAVILRRLGDFAGAEAEYRRAIGMDPDLAQAVADLGFVAYSLRRFPEALAWYDSAVAMTRSGAWQHLSTRALARLALGDTAGARRDAEMAAAPAGSTPLAVAILAEVEAAGGDTAGAHRRLEPLLARFASGPVSVRDGYQIVAAIAAVGDKERAIELLERIRPRGAWLWSYLVFRDFDPLRGDPRFQRIYDEARPPGAPRLP